jgi:hypothetical protein
MPTVEEIFEDPPESWEISDDYFEDDLGWNAEQASDEMLDKLDKTSDGSDGKSDGSDEIEPEDWISMSTVHDPAEFIQASSTTSQHLSEAFAKNSTFPKSFHKSVSSAFQDFEDVFSKVSFDMLPGHDSVIYTHSERMGQPHVQSVWAECHVSNALANRFPY